MSKLTPVNYDRVVKVLVDIGYAVNNQKGSHIVMRLADQQKYISLFGDGLERVNGMDLISYYS